MEIFIGILILFFVALLITAIFGLALNSRGPWGSYWTFFIFIFLFIWTADAWVNPIGPIYYGLALGPILFVGVVIALFLTAASSPESRRRGIRSKKDPQHESNLTERRAKEFVAMDIFFWLTMLVLTIAIIASYY